MAEKRGKKDRDWKNLGRKDRLRDQVCILEQRRCRARDRLLEQQPRQEARKQEYSVVVRNFTRGRLLLHADLEDERPTQEHHQRLYYAPKPAARRTDKALGEIPLDELNEEGAP